MVWPHTMVSIQIKIRIAGIRLGGDEVPLVE